MGQFAKSCKKYNVSYLLCVSAYLPLISFHRDIQFFCYTHVMTPLLSKSILNLLKSYQLCPRVNYKALIKHFNIIVSVAIALSGKLPGVLDDELDPSTRKIHVNMVKMTCYLLCQFLEMLEAEETKPSTAQVITKVTVA